MYICIYIYTRKEQFCREI